MGCRFGLNGKMILRESEEVASDLEDLKELIGEIEMTCQAKDGLVEVSLSGEYSMSYSTAVEIEKSLKDFSAHIVEATYFDTDCDGEEGIIWVGTPENIKQAQRGKLIYETVVLLQQLTPDEIQKALKMASDTKPAAPPDNMTFDGKWRPIATAPKDTLVLVCRFVNNEWHMCESELYYDAGSEVNNEPPGGWIWSNDHDNDSITMDEGPTYWMPRPSFYEEALAEGCEADEDNPRLNKSHPEHDLYLLSDMIFKGFSCYHDSVVLDRVDRFDVKTEKGDYTLTIEEEDYYNPLNMGTHLNSSGKPPKKLKDHVTVMDVALIGLGADPAIAKEITDLVTDGDHKDCEADFNFRGKAWTIKVR